jgi:predicted ATP-grasp superfamily ATP-dependent carboligase
MDTQGQPDLDPITQGATMLKIISKTFTRAGVTANKGLQLVEVSLDQSLQEAIDEAMTEVNNLASSQEERDKHLERLYR